MSVTATITIRRRSIFNPLRDRTLPENIWFANGGIIGDASGGHMEVNILLNESGGLISGRAWSLEQSFPTMNINTSGNIIVRGENMDVYGPGQQNQVVKDFAQTFIGNGNVEAAEVAVALNMVHPHLFYGSQGAVTSNAQIRYQFSNINGNTLGIYCTGYEWGPEAVALGPRIPLGSIL